MNQLRILQICHDDKGPFVAIARQYANAFSDCKVTTVFLRGAWSAKVEGAIPGEVVFLDLRKGALRGLKHGARRRIQARIADEVPGIIVAHRYKPFFIALTLGRACRAPLILGVVHEFGFLRRKTRALFSHFWGEGVELIGVSKPVVEEIGQKLPHLANRVHVIPNAIETTTLLDPVSARHELGIPMGKYCYGVIGRLVKKKDHALLIDAFSTLEDDSVLAIIGDGRLMPELQAQTEALGAGGRVIFCGHRPEARQYLKGFDCFVFPSTYREAFGLVLLEAMQAMIPVVSADAPGPVSVLGDTAGYFRTGDADDLKRALILVKQRTRQENNAVTQSALERLGTEFSAAVVAARLRSLPSVAKLIDEHNSDTDGSNTS